MDFGGSFSQGDFPDDPDGHDEGSDGVQRGWLPPEDRLWRHPSEIAELGPPRHASSYFDTGAGGWRRRRVRRSSVAVGVVGVAALAATVAVVLSVVDSPGLPAALRAQGRVVSTTSMTTAVLGHDVTNLVASVRPSLVRLEPLAGTGTRTTGVVLPGGSLVLTAASAVTGASEIQVVTADGRRHRGKVVGTDTHAGVAVVSTDGGMVPATFADENVEPDDLAVVACLCTAAAPSSFGGAAAGVGMVTAVGTGVTVEGGPDLLSAIEAEVPLGPASWGDVLLDGRGRVIGILDGQMSNGSDTVGLYVPAPLAESVALELAQTHHIDHGWLGIECADQGSDGAMVTAFLPGSPAATAGLHLGDVVVAVGPHTVGSVADLQARLYTMAPGATVELSVERDGAGPLTMPVTLARTPAS